MAYTAITLLESGPSSDAVEMNSQNDAIELIQLYVQDVQRAFSAIYVGADHTL